MDLKEMREMFGLLSVLPCLCDEFVGPFVGDGDGLFDFVGADAVQGAVQVVEVDVVETKEAGTGLPTVVKDLRADVFLKFDFDDAGLEQSFGFVKVRKEAGAAWWFWREHVFKSLLCFG